ncbi:DUF4214 domain-containing protein [Brevundimonas sp.]|uniref:DUF4214 domain-containing protein n=1 Tax=Brevundimonas sp. TaxID=1871086 RepID=UPI002ED9DDC9
MSPFQNDHPDASNSFTGVESDPLSFLNADSRGAGAAPNGKPSLTTADAALQLTRTGASWLAGQPLGSGVTVSFAFRSNAPTTMPTDTGGFSQFSAAQIAATLLALQAWADVANIRFVRVDDGNGYSDNATMLFSNYSSGHDGAAAFAYMPGSSSTGSASGDVWVNNTLSYNATPVQLGFGVQALVHEIGHALGLSHPATYNASQDENITYSQHATYYEDSRQYTVMSYFSESNTGGSFARNYASAPLLDDIAAIQRLYGANMTTRIGDTVYGFNSNAGQPWFIATSATASLIFSVWDAGGVDTLDFSKYSQNQVIDLRQGHFSNVGGLIGNVSIAMGAVIENAIGGAGADTLIGNSASNRLVGGAGNDDIDGGAGSDTAVFSGNRSAYTIDTSGPKIVVTGPDGTDTLVNVEFLQFADQTIATSTDSGLVLTGGAGAETLTGSERNDQIDGGGGADTLIGLGGADYLAGGDGDDILIGGKGGDTLVGGAGVDTAVFGGLSRGYASVSSTSVAGGRDGGTDSLSSIEKIKFLDGVRSYVTTDLYAVVYRLYDAAFDREPDPAGLANYAQALASGTTVTDILKIFASSAEFQKRYGGTDNETYVRLMYQYSLDRQPDAAGLAQHVASLNNGVSRVDLLATFSESAEHKQLMATKIAGSGIWIQDEATLAVARLYDSILDRVPDIGGLEHYRSAVDQGVGLQQFADNMVQSPEFRARYGDLSNTDFVKQIYRFVLDREADAKGLGEYVAALNNGMTRAELVIIFSESPEHRASYQSTWETSVRNLENGRFAAPEAVESLDGDAAPQTQPLADAHFGDPADGWAHHDAFVLPAVLPLDGPLVQPALFADEALDLQPQTLPLIEAVAVPLTLDDLQPHDGLISQPHHDDWFLAA